MSGITLNIERGDYLGVVGPNGGGKSTLIRVLLGLEKPKAGTVRIFGQPLAEFREYNRIGYVPQHIAHRMDTIHFPATVREIVVSGRTSRRSTLSRLGREDRQVLEKVMRVAGIWNFRDRLLHELSGGERQRVFIARALASEPEILILDEPTVGVDMNSQSQFHEFLRKLNQQQGITVIYITHDLDVIVKEAQKVICLNQRLACYGDPRLILSSDEIRKNYGLDVHKIEHKHTH